MIPDLYSLQDLAWIAVAVFLLGMSKGGFPVGPVALQIFVLFWPGPVDPARSAVSFMLPILCTMDIVAVIFYRRDIVWESIMPLLPWTVAGIIAGSLLFVSQSSAKIIPDTALKFCIGFIGLSFVLYNAVRGRISGGIKNDTSRNRYVTAAAGSSAGLISTFTHAAGPIFQMYILPQQLTKTRFAATGAAFFFLVNMMKLVPYSLSGRIRADDLPVMLIVLPLIPAGVAAGYFLVKIILQKHYNMLIYSVLFITSCILIIKTFTGR